MYTEEEVYQASLQYFNGDDLAAKVWTKKYALKDQRGNLYELTPNDMFTRLAKEYSRIENNYPNPISYETILDLLKDFKYLVPGGSQLSGVGNPYQIISLSNCFVIESPIDSYGGIMKTDEEQVQIMKRRGGVGHDISNLRPSGVVANNALLKGGSGATLYMDRYSNSTREVSQGDRRGALMLSMNIHHPDSDKFIDAKLDTTKVTGANISLRISDDFVDSVKRKNTFWQTFPIDLKIPLGEEYDQVSYNLKLNELVELPNNVGYIKSVDANKLFNKIAENAWKSAEPGLLFWDRILQESPAACYNEEWREKSTNPCGEIPLCPYDSCRLLAINLFSYVTDPFTSEAKFNFELFKQHVYIAQRMMDDLVDLEIEAIKNILVKIELDPEDEETKFREKNLWWKILNKAIRGRRTGLGITAEGDMLAAMGLRYGTEEATAASEYIHRTMAIESYKSSIDMAEERGAFPEFDWQKEKENKSGFLNRMILNLPAEYVIKWTKTGRRNLANLTIAPTGTLSTLTQTTSGVEPLIFPFYFRKRKTYDNDKVDFIDEVGDKWEEFSVIHKGLKLWYKINYNESIENLKKEELQKIYELSPYYLASSTDVDWRESVRMQGRIQQWVDHSISKTINLPKTATIEEVKELYLLAYNSGCKGVTVYRDGSRSGVITQEKSKQNKFEYNNAFKRPEVVECDIYHKTSLKEDWMILVGLVDGNPYEIFAFKDPDNCIFPKKIEKGIITKVKSKTYKLEGTISGKKYCIKNVVDLMSVDDRVDTRKYSSMLRHGMAPKFIVDQIEEFATIVSFDKVIQRTLRNYLNEEEKKEYCPECGNGLIREEGCVKCTSCEYSKCG